MKSKYKNHRRFALAMNKTNLKLKSNLLMGFLVSDLACKKFGSNDSCCNKIKAKQTGKPLLLDPSKI